LLAGSDEVFKPGRGRLALSAGGSPVGAGSLLRRLRRLQASLWLENTLQQTVRGLCLGLAFALGGALVLTMQAGALDRRALLLFAVGGLVTGLLWGLCRPPSLARAARTADARLGLEARLGTAVELLRQPAAGRFVGPQLTDASRVAVRPGWPMPVTLAWRELGFALLLALAVLLLLRLEGVGRSLLTGLPSLLAEPAPDGPDRTLASPAAAPAAGAERQQPDQSAQSTTALRALDELRRARAAGQLDSEQARRALERLESELGQQATEARRQREPLDRLGRALGQVSAGEAAAESLQRGDYQQAGEQLAELARESDQLSREARNQLAQSLRRAAAESAAHPALAERERRAAEALAGRDYGNTESALRALGEQVAQAGQATASQSELGEAMRQLDQERASSGQPAAAAAERSASAPGQQSAEGGPGGSQAGDGQGRGQSSAGGSQIEPGAAAEPQAARPGGEQPDEPAPLGAAAQRLEVAGKQVEVPARPGGAPDRGPETARPGDQEQVVGDRQQTFESDRPASTVQGGGPAERIVVPGDQRQVVRDYFAQRARRGGR
jgi:hypothetical protein